MWVNEAKSRTLLCKCLVWISWCRLQTRFLLAGPQVVNQKGANNVQLFKSKEVNFEKLGIGGLDAQFADIFRRAFASRVFPPSVVTR